MRVGGVGAMMGRIAQVPRILLFNAAVLCAGIVILELIFGNWLQENRLNRLNIIRDRTFTFELGSLYESPSKTTTYTRDRYGLRGNFREPGQIDILTVGGSTTDQRFITDGETWQDVLQRRFQDAGRTVVVANAGVDGQSTIGNIRDFDWWFPHVPGLKPKYVIFYVGLNDFYLVEGNGYDVLENAPAVPSLRQLLRARSAVYHALQTLYGVYLAEVKQGIGHRSIRFSEVTWTRTPLQASYEGILATSLKEYGERLEALVAKTKELGATAIFVTQPSRRYRYRDGFLEGEEQATDYKGVPINGVDFFFIMRKFDEVMKTVSHRHHLMLIDLAQEKSWSDEDFYDTAHMTPKGTKKVGELLFLSMKDLP